MKRMFALKKMPEMRTETTFQEEKPAIHFT